LQANRKENQLTHDRSWWYRRSRRADSWRRSDIFIHCRNE